MGTLLKQEPRINALKYFASEKETIDWCHWIDKQAKDLGWEPADVLKAFELQELENAVYKQGCKGLYFSVEGFALNGYIDHIDDRNFFNNPRFA